MTLLLPDIFSGFSAIYAGTESDGRTSGQKTTISKTFRNAANGFKKVIVALTSPEDGYVSG